MSFKRARVLLVGCGNIAGGFDMARPSDAWPLTHAGAYRRHGGFELSACIEPDVERRAAFAQHWNIEKHAASFNELAAKTGDFDVISICSPTAFHHQHLEEALRLSPRLIFCEKPLTNSIERSRQWVHACAAQRVQLVVNYTRQWDPAVQALLEELEADQWGAIRSIACFYNKGVVNNGGHLIDLLLRLLGPLEVVAVTGRDHDFWPDDPTVAALLCSRETGVPVSLNPSNAQDFSYFELELVCEMGVIRMRNGGMQWEVRRASSSEHFKGYKALAEVECREGEYMQAMTRAVTEIYDHLNKRHAVRSTGESALAVHALCDQILEAAKASVSLTN